MKTCKLEFDNVNLPINNDTINILGKENGISMYIIKTMRVDTFFKGFDECMKEINIEETVFSTRTLKIDECSNGYIGTIDSNFYYDYKDETIVEICKLEF